MADDLSKVGKAGAQAGQEAGSRASGTAAKAGVKKTQELASVLAEGPKLALAVMGLVGAGMLWLALLRLWGAAAVLAGYLLLLGWVVFKRQDTGRLPILEVLGVLLLAFLLAVGVGHHKTAKRRAETGKVGELRLDLDSPSRTMRELVAYLSLSPKEEKELVERYAQLSHTTPEKAQKELARFWKRVSLATTWLCWSKAFLAPITRHPSVWWAGLWYAPDLIEAVGERGVYEKVMETWLTQTQAQAREKRERALREALESNEELKALKARLERLTGELEKAEKDIEKLEYWASMYQWNTEISAGFKGSNWEKITTILPEIKDWPKKHHWRTGFAHYVITREEAHRLAQKFREKEKPFLAKKKALERQIQETEGQIDDLKRRIQAEVKNKYPVPAPPQSRLQRVLYLLHSHPDSPGTWAVRVAGFSLPGAGAGAVLGSDLPPEWRQDYVRIRTAWWLLALVVGGILVIWIGPWAMAAVVGTIVCFLASYYVAMASGEQVGWWHVGISAVAGAVLATIYRWRKWRKRREERA